MKLDSFDLLFFTELTNTMKMGEGSYTFVFTELPFKTVSGDDTAFHRIERSITKNDFAMDVLVFI